MYVVHLLSLLFKLLGNALHLSPLFKPVYAGGVFFFFYILFLHQSYGIEIQVSYTAQALLPPFLILFPPTFDTQQNLIKARGRNGRIDGGMSKRMEDQVGGWMDGLMNELMKRSEQDWMLEGWVDVWISG